MEQAPKCCPCAPAYGGGWWFYRQVIIIFSLSCPVTHFSCFEANLNGEYFADPEDNGYYRGIIWELWLGDNSLKAARMMVRSKGYTVI